MQSLCSFDGPVWRILPQTLVDSPVEPARAPEGRFHHSGQIAAYASLSAEGASVAIQRYLGDRARGNWYPCGLNLTACLMSAATERHL
jgi:hypothetical protein